MGSEVQIPFDFAQGRLFVKQTTGGGSSSAYAAGRGVLIRAKRSVRQVELA